MAGTHTFYDVVLEPHAVISTDHIIPGHDYCVTLQYGDDAKQHIFTAQPITQQGEALFPPHQMDKRKAQMVKIQRNEAVGRRQRLVNVTVAGSRTMGGDLDVGIAAGEIDLYTLCHVNRDETIAKTEDVLLTGIEIPGVVQFFFHLIMYPTGNARPKIGTSSSAPAPQQAPHGRGAPPMQRSSTAVTPARHQPHPQHHNAGGDEELQAILEEIAIKEQALARLASSTSELPQLIESRRQKQEQLAKLEREEAAAIEEDKKQNVSVNLKSLQASLREAVREQKVAEERLAAIPEADVAALLKHLNANSVTGAAPKSASGKVVAATRGEAVYAGTVVTPGGNNQQQQADKRTNEQKEQDNLVAELKSELAAADSQLAALNEQQGQRDVTEEVMSLLEMTEMLKGMLAEAEKAKRVADQNAAKQQGNSGGPVGPSSAGSSSDVANTDPAHRDLMRLRLQKLRLTITEARLQEIGAGSDNNAGLPSEDTIASDLLRLLPIRGNPGAQGGQRHDANNGSRGGAMDALFQ